MTPNKFRLSRRIRRGENPSIGRYVTASCRSIREITESPLCAAPIPFGTVATRHTGAGKTPNLVTLKTPATEIGVRSVSAEPWSNRQS
jgi:hypothetical protein